MEEFIPQFMAHMKSIQSFVDDHRATERTQERLQDQRHRENSERLERMQKMIAFIGVLLTAMGLIVSIVSVIVMMKQAHLVYIRDWFRSGLPILAETLNSKIPTL